MLVVADWSSKFFV